jgi:aminoglycoside/choline kinase family phosphotransferase
MPRLAGSTPGAALLPGWLVTRHGRDRAAGLRVTGQFSSEGNDGLTRFRGEPPAWVERESLPERIEAERSALLALEGAGGLTPVLYSDQRDFVVSASMIAGRTLPVRDLTDDQFDHWTERAAAALADLQTRTRQHDGSVLVHGDYWLGNLLVEGDRVVGVIDWEDAHRGSPDIDREFLVRSLLSFTGRTTDETLARRLEQAVQRGTSQNS